MSRPAKQSISSRRGHGYWQPHVLAAAEVGAVPVTPGMAPCGAHACWHAALCTSFAMPLFPVEDAGSAVSCLLQLARDAPLLFMAYGHCAEASSKCLLRGPC